MLNDRLPAARVSQPPALVTRSHVSGLERERSQRAFCKLPCFVFYNCLFVFVVKQKQIQTSKSGLERGRSQREFCQLPCFLFHNCRFGVCYETQTNKNVRIQAGKRTRSTPEGVQPSVFDHYISILILKQFVKVDRAWRRCDNCGNYDVPKATLKAFSGAFDRLHSWLVAITRSLGRIHKLRYQNQNTTF